MLVNDREENIGTMERLLNSMLCAVQLNVLSGRNCAVSVLKPSCITAKGSQKLKTFISSWFLTMHYLFLPERRGVLC